MKTCPICHANSFEDMQTCFGCMHRFDDEPKQLVVKPAVEALSIEEPTVAEPPQRIEIPLVEPEPIMGKHVAVEQKPLLFGNEARYELVVSLQPVMPERLPALA